MMNWGSASNFFEMGGYGLYVWGSFGACALAVVGELAALSARRRALSSAADPGDDPLEGGPRTSNET
jgi:heme exporter protein D